MSSINASLTYKEKDDIKSIVLLPGERVTFGRDNRNDVKLALLPLDQEVFQWATADISRQHFVISRKEDGYTIQDLGSTNGTSLDCIALLSKEQYLHDGQVIDVGGVLDMKVLSVKGDLWLFRMTNTPQEAYLLFKNDIHIGNPSIKENTIVFDAGSAILPFHARIKYDSNKYYLSKEDEKAIVLLNETSLKKGEEIPLGREEQITLGDILILFRLEMDESIF